MDTPGYNAEYCTYTVMDNESKDILDMQIVNKRDTGFNSVIMETEGLERTMKYLVKDKKVRVKELATDAHVQIRSRMGKLNSIYLLLL